MGNFASNVVEESSDFDELAMLFKEVGKIAFAAGWSPVLLLEVIFWFCFVVFLYTMLKKIVKKAKNSENSLNSLLLERIGDLAMPLESLQIEVEELGKQKEPVEGQ